MNSPMGLRGVICERFGWTYEYLLDGIPWMDVHTMMKDAPQYIADPPKPPTAGTPTAPALPPTPESPQEEKSNGEKLNNYLTQFL